MIVFGFPAFHNIKTAFDYQNPHKNTDKYIRKN